MLLRSSDVFWSNIVDGIGRFLGNHKVETTKMVLGNSNQHYRHATNQQVFSGPQNICTFPSVTICVMLTQRKTAKAVASVIVVSVSEMQWGDCFSNNLSPLKKLSSYLHPWFVSHPSFILLTAFKQIFLQLLSVQK